jgi:hypothetical protein
LSELSPPSPETPEGRAIRARVLDLFTAIVVLMLLGIAVLVVYVIRLGGLNGPGVEESFGIAVALMFLMAALIVHTVDYTYRVWPLGRRYHPTPPAFVTEAGQVRFVKILIVVVTAAAIAYILGGLIAG